LPGRSSPPEATACKLLQGDPAPRAIMKASGTAPATAFTCGFWCWQSISITRMTRERAWTSCRSGRSPTSRASLDSTY